MEAEPEDAMEAEPEAAMEAEPGNRNGSRAGRTQVKQKRKNAMEAEAEERK